ncbi:MAG: hypothetical protein WD335_02740 [Candidatus Paceibacterota bacterium]
MEVTICSSVDFTYPIIEIKKVLEERGDTVNIPYFTQMIIDGKLSFEDYMKTKQSGGDISLRNQEDVDFYARYWKFISRSDAVLILNLEKHYIKGYIGGNTLIDMSFAYIQEKPIYLYNPIPERSARMHYVDELKDFKPTIINEDLSLIK